MEKIRLYTFVAAEGAMGWMGKRSRFDPHENEAMFYSCQEESGKDVKIFLAHAELRAWRSWKIAALERGGAGEAFGQALAGAGLCQGMSGRANPYDNAWTESSIATLKTEMLQGGCFQTAADARLEIFDYIDGYYNTHRKHSALDYLTPSQFETQIHSVN